jgi:hypothetical protein
MATAHRSGPSPDRRIDAASLAGGCGRGVTQPHEQAPSGGAVEPAWLLSLIRNSSSSSAAYHT